LGAFCTILFIELVIDKIIMNNKIFSILVVILALVAGHYLVTNIPDRADIEETTEVVVDISADKVVGFWRSIEDSKFTREFLTDGTIIDKYNGDDSATSIGVWSYVEDLKALPTELPETDSPVIKAVFNEETFYFGVVFENSGENLSLSYLNGNGILNFVREVGVSKDTQTEF